MTRKLTPGFGREKAFAITGRSLLVIILAICNMKEFIHGTFMAGSVK